MRSGVEAENEAVLEAALRGRPDIANDMRSHGETAFLVSYSRPSRDWLEVSIDARQIRAPRRTAIPEMPQVTQQPQELIDMMLPPLEPGTDLRTIDIQAHLVDNAARGGPLVERLFDFAVRNDPSCESIRQYYLNTDTLAYHVVYVTRIPYNRNTHVWQQRTFTASQTSINQTWLPGNLRTSEERAIYLCRLNDLYFHHMISVGHAHSHASGHGGELYCVTYAALVPTRISAPAPVLAPPSMVTSTVTTTNLPPNYPNTWFIPPLPSPPNNEETLRAMGALGMDVDAANSALEELSRSMRISGESVDEMARRVRDLIESERPVPSLSREHEALVAADTALVLSSRSNRRQARIAKEKVAQELVEKLKEKYPVKKFDKRPKLLEVEIPLPRKSRGDIL